MGFGRAAEGERDYNDVYVLVYIFISFFLS